MGLAVGAGALGSFFKGQSAADKANAANAILRQKIGILDKFGVQNANTFNNNMVNYAPGNQAVALDTAQTDRGNTAAGNITTPAGAGENDIPLTPGAPKAVKSEIAKRMLGVYDNAVARAKALGRFGGYGDVWFNNRMGNEEAGRNIGFTNNLAEGQKALIVPEQQAAINGAGNNDALLGSILTGAGSVLGGYAGQGGSISSWLPQSVPLAGPADPMTGGGYGIGGVY